MPPAPSPLARFAAHYGLDAAALRRPHPDTGYAEDVAILGAGAGFTGAVAGLQCRPVGRFGNVVAQALNATLFARRAGIAHIGLVMGPVPAPRPQRLGPLTFHADITAARAPVAASEFLATTPFAPVLGALPTGLVAETVEDFIRPLYRHIAPSPAVREDTVVVHIRAGDIFQEADNGDDWVNRLYVQPPASYYLRAIEESRRLFGARDVLIVYQGMANPALGALAEALLRRRIPFATQSASVEEDVATLLAARHLVTSYGTFSEAVATLSTRLRRIWCFRTLESHRHLHPGRTAVLADLLLHRGVEILWVDDSNGGYIPAQQWKNTPEQLALIRGYPGENLAWRRITPADAT